MYISKPVYKANKNLLLLLHIYTLKYYQINYLKCVPYLMKILPQNVSLAHFLTSVDSSNVSLFFCL